MHSSRKSNGEKRGKAKAAKSKGTKEMKEKRIEQPAQLSYDSCYPIAGYLAPPLQNPHSTTSLGAAEDLLERGLNLVGELGEIGAGRLGFDGRIFLGNGDLGDVFERQKEEVRTREHP